MSPDLLRPDLLVPALMYCALLWWVGRGLCWTAKLATAVVTLVLIVVVCWSSAAGTRSPKQKRENNPMHSSRQEDVSAAGLRANNDSARSHRSLSRVTGSRHRRGHVLRKSGPLAELGEPARQMRLRRAGDPLDAEPAPRIGANSDIGERELHRPP